MTDETNNDPNQQQDDESDTSEIVQQLKEKYGYLLALRNGRDGR
jgi:hypothetical protein